MPPPPWPLSAQARQLPFGDGCTIALLHHVEHAGLVEEVYPTTFCSRCQDCRSSSSRACSSFRATADGSHWSPPASCYFGCLCARRTLLSLFPHPHWCVRCRHHECPPRFGNASQSPPPNTSRLQWRPGLRSFPRSPSLGPNTGRLHCHPCQRMPHRRPLLGHNTGRCHWRPCPCRFHRRPLLVPNSG